MILAKIIIKVIENIKKLFFLATELKNEVIRDFSVFFTFISLSVEKIFISEGREEK